MEKRKIVLISKDWNFLEVGSSTKVCVYICVLECWTNSEL